MRQRSILIMEMNTIFSIGTFVLVISLLSTIGLMWIKPFAAAAEEIQKPGPLHQPTDNADTHTASSAVRSTDKKSLPALARKSHRLIRRPDLSQSKTTVAPVESLDLSGPPQFVPASTPSSQNESGTTPAKPSTLAMPGAPVSSTSTLNTGQISTSATPSTVPINRSSLTGSAAPALAAVSGSSGTSSSLLPKLGRLMSEIPGLAQMLTPSSSTPPPPSTGTPPTPTIGLSATSVSFSGIQGGTAPTAKTVTISNSGAGTLNWTVTENSPWLTVSPTSGTGSGTLTFSVDMTGMLAGTTSAQVTVSASGSTNTPQTIAVSLSLTAPQIATIGLNPANLSFTATQGGANPTAKIVNITNPGTGTLTWSASDNAAWLTLSTASGTTTTETDPISVSVNASGLAVGTYNAAITVTGTGATNTPQSIPVTLTVTSPATATLTWTANTETDLSGYKIYRRTASSPSYGAPLATLQGSSTTTYTATGQQAGSIYFFVITAYDSAGNESTFSNEVSKTF